MDEYFCPNCGATLNNQYGFDPDNGYWTCTQCGKVLVDEDTYEGDSYKGVAWFCDDCGAFLNKQPGFSDSYGSWTCTACGHTNGITDEDIVEESTSCPNCGANLKKQFCYGDYLDDWECTECGAHLHHSYSSDPYSIVEENENDEYGDDSDTTDEYDDGEDSYREYSYSSRNYYSRRSRFSFKELLRKICKILIVLKKIVIGVIISAVIGLIAYSAYEVYKQIPAGIDSDIVQGQQYESVVVQFVEAGFKNVTPKALGDLELAEENQAGIVDYISIDGDTSFAASSKYPNDAQVFVYYHSIRLISPPISSRDAKNRNYAEVFKAYQEAGFVSIKLEVIDDLIFGWLTKDGSVESVAIDGLTKFSEEYACRPDAEVVIKYHTFPE